MRRPTLVPTLIAVALAFGLPSVGSAQDNALPTATPTDPKGVVPDQRIENADKGMVYAAEVLEKAAVVDNDAARQDAFTLSRQTVEDARDLFPDLPPDQRTSYEEAILKVEQALAAGDPKAGAAAMRDLRQRLLELVRSRG
jgi:hypothetical protein